MVHREEAVRSNEAIESDDRSQNRCLQAKLSSDLDETEWLFGRESDHHPRGQRQRERDGVFQPANLFEEMVRQRRRRYRFAHAASSSGVSQSLRNAD